MEEKKGKIIVLSAPSGSGKSTIISHLMKNPELKLDFSISATSRAPRGQEQHGKEYFFLSEEEFHKNVEVGNFVEWEEVYSGVCYGTLVSEVERITGSGHNLIMDVDVKGALNIKKRYGDEVLTIFIMPPNKEELEQRLRNRGTDSEETIEKRLHKSEYEMTFAPQFDCVIINDHLETAVSEVTAKIESFIGLKSGKNHPGSSYSHKDKIPMPFSEETERNTITKKVAVFGGSFDPIHTGHVMLANFVAQCGVTDNVCLMVSRQNPLKENSPVASDNQRIEMARRATEGFINIFVSNFEMHLPSPSYTYDTLKALKEKYPDNEFQLIIGSDSLENFPRWKNSEKILKEFEVIVYPRPGYPLSGEEPAGMIYLTGAPEFSISSSLIREYIQWGWDIRYFVPIKVAEYIKTHKIYEK